MIKAKVIENFNFARKNELKNLEKRNTSTEMLEVGDIFECTKEMADYLLGDNSFKRAFIEIIEAKPEEKKPAKKITKKAKK